MAPSSYDSSDLSVGRAQAGGSPGHVRALLQLAVEQTGLDVCLLTRKQGDRWLVIESSAPEGDVPLGLSMDWQLTLCAQTASGRAPNVTPDLSQSPLLQAVADAAGMPVGAFVCFPLRDESGLLLGTLCGISAGPLPQELHAQASLLRTLAHACTGLVSGELALTAARAEADLRRPDEKGPGPGLLSPAAWATQLWRHADRSTRLGASSSVLLLDVQGPASAEVLLAVLAVLDGADSATQLEGGRLALLLADTSVTAAAARRARLQTRLRGTGQTWRTAARTASDAMPLASALATAGSVLDATPWSPPTGRPSTDRDVRVRELLEQVRTHLGQDVAMLTRDVDGAQLLDHVVAPDGLPDALTRARRYDAGLCARVADGRLPDTLPDVTRYPVAREVDLVRDGVLASYVSAQVRLPDGSLYGTLCCASGRPSPQLTHRSATMLQVVAGALAELLDDEHPATVARRVVLGAVADLVTAGGPIAVYQPLVETGTLRVVGAEGLARFPDGRSPLDWFEQALAHGVGVDLEVAAARAALRGLAPLAAEGRFLSVNLSPDALRAPAVGRLLDEVADQGLLGALVVEVTEHEAVGDYDALNRLMRPWRDAGMRVAIDDTGAGHASLRHVLLLDPEIIKLDRGLVTAVECDRHRADLIASLVTFADRGGRLLVAEGVETAAELDCLTGLGVHLVQGYHLARPRPELVLEVAGASPSVPAPRRPSAVSRG